jgi:hypothetical protein
VPRASGIIVLVNFLDNGTLDLYKSNIKCLLLITLSGHVIEIVCGQFPVISLKFPSLLNALLCYDLCLHNSRFSFCKELTCSDYVTLLLHVRQLSILFRNITLFSGNQNITHTTMLHNVREQW